MSSTKDVDRAQVSENHHSVPQSYLRAWSLDGHRVSARRLLVPNEAYPEWELRPIRSLTAYQHLYTTIRDGVPTDSFEQWLNHEIETPAADVIRRIGAGSPLDVQDLDVLVRFVAALDRRTPAAYLESVERWERDVPVALKRSVNRVMRRRSGTDARPHDTDVPAMREDFPHVRVSIDRDLVNGGGTVKAEVTMGRQLWVAEMRHLLTVTYKHLLEHKWSILKPYPGCEWFTSDHPVTRLNWMGRDKYDFGGGWGSRGSDIMLPLSPTSLLHARIGHASVPETELSRELTLDIQKVVAERAHRWIFATGEPLRAVWFRTRAIDLAKFNAEDEEWRRWPEKQAAAESGDLDGGP